MKLVELEQGTLEWIDFRRKRITATDFSAYAAHLGLSKSIYRKSLKSLINEKIEGRVIPDNKYFKLGRDKEPELIARGNFVNPICGEVVLHSDNDLIMASLDARDDILNTVIEIKATTKDPSVFHELVQYHQYQMTHQCYVAGCEQARLIMGFYKELPNKSWQETAILTTDVYPDRVMNYNTWLSHCATFLEILQDETDG